MLRKITLLVSLFVLVFFCLAIKYSSPERITNFSSNIIVQHDSILAINEIISVYSEQNKIRHAIVRRLPMNYIDSYGVKHKTIYHIRKVLINDTVSNFSTKIANDQFIIYIGNPNTILAPGNYIFTIQYFVYDANTFLPDHDELYWNITGNNWDYPIDKVEATIELPEGATFLRYSGFTGKSALTGNDFSISLPAPNKITFVTTKPIMRKQSFAILLSWPKGFVHPYSPVKVIAIKLREFNLDLFMFFGSLILLILYLILRPRLFRRKS